MMIWTTRPGSARALETEQPHVRDQRQNLLLFNLVPLKLVLPKAGGGEQTPSPEEAEVMRRRTSAVAPAPTMLSEAGP